MIIVSLTFSTGSAIFGNVLQVKTLSIAFVLPDFNSSCVSRHTIKLYHLPTVSSYY